MKRYIDDDELFEKNQINQINQINGVEKKSNQSFHMRPSIAKEGRDYAHAAKISTGDFAEKAFVEFMVNHPLDMRVVVLQSTVSEELPSKLEVIQMKLLTREIRFVLEALESAEPHVKGGLLNRLVKALNKGVILRNPSDDFVTLLEEAIKHI